MFSWQSHRKKGDCFVLRNDEHNWHSGNTHPDVIAPAGTSLRENGNECLLFKWMLNVFVAIF